MIAKGSTTILVPFKRSSNGSQPESPRANDMIPVVRSFTVSPLDSSNEPSHSLRSSETPRYEANTVVNRDDRQYMIFGGNR
jgi:hypothetical protein